MKYLYKISFVFLFGGTLLTYAQQKEWDLDACVDYAIEHNLQVNAQELNLEEAKINTSNAKGSFLPNLNGSLTNTWSNGLSENPNTGRIIDQQNRVSGYGLNSDIPIYNGFRNYNALEQAKLNELSAALSIEKIKDDIRLSVANRYLQVLLQKENISILKAQYQLTQEQLKRAQELVGIGSLPKGELYQLEATAATDLQSIAEAENSFTISEISLKRLLNIDLSNDMTFKKEEMKLEQLNVLDKSIDSIVNYVLINRNEIKLSEKNVEVAKTGIKIAKGAYLPTVSGFVRLRTNEQKESVSEYFKQLNSNRNVSAGLSLNIPILNRNRTKNGVTRSKINVLKRENQLAQTKLKLVQDVQQVYLNAIASKKTYEAAKQTVVAQKTAFEYQQTRFNVGVSNLLEYTQNKIRYQNSQTQLIRSKYDLLFRLKLLELYYPVQ